MKIICVDNFDRDEISDQLIAENVSKYYAPLIVEYLNDTQSGSTSPNYFKYEEDTYKLYTWEP